MRLDDLVPPGGHVPDEHLVLGLARPRRDDLRAPAVQRRAVAGKRVGLVVCARVDVRARVADGNIAIRNSLPLAHAGIGTQGA